MAMHQKHKT